MNTSSNDITNSIFLPLKAWTEESAGNWNMLLGVGFLLIIIGVALMYLYTKRIGEMDERTNEIHLKSAYVLLLAIILLDIALPKEYMWQIFFLFKYGTAFIASGAYMAIRHHKELAV